MSLSPRWKKLLADLQSTRGRALMMVAALAVGIFALATIVTAYTILTREISRNYLGTHPAAASIELERIDPAVLGALRRQPGVADAEAGATVLASVETGPGGALPLLLFVVSDFTAMRLNSFRPEAGAWPPPDGTLLLERAALSLVRAPLGAMLQMRGADGSRHSLRIAGLVHDAGLAPAWQEQTVYGYITPATLAMLGDAGVTRFVKLGFSDTGFDPAAIDAAVARAAGWLTRAGLTPGEIRIPPPGRHPHQSQMSAILLMLLIFSGMALALGAVLTATMIGALLAQQVRQIGVMKAIGARSWQIARIYLLLVALMALAALALGLPAGLAAGRAFARAIAELLNFTLYSEAVPHWTYPAQIAAGLLVPLATALVPIFRASRATVHAAINDAGVSRQSLYSSRLAALLGRLRGHDGVLVLAVRNTFRRRGRLALTLGLLAAAGAMFLTSLNVKSAWEQNLADAAAQRHYDLEIRLTAPADQAALLALVGALPGVRKVEAWNVLPAADRPDGLDIVRTYPDGGHGNFTLRSVPPASTMIDLTLLSGRWLRPGDGDAVVLNHMAQALFPHAAVGQTITLRVGGRPSRFRVVGIAREIITPAAAYTSPEGYARATALPGRVNALRVAVGAHGEAGVAAATLAIRRALAQAGVNTKVEISEARLDGALSGHVYILIFALIAMSVLLALVGALGLASTMGSNVLERTRELGVMRAIGATSRMVLRGVVSEGVLIGLLSWLIALPLSVPLSGAVGSVLGVLAFRSPLPLFISLAAVFAWLLLIVLVALLASAWPAWQASRLTIRETLAYI